MSKAPPFQRFRSAVSVKTRLLRPTGAWLPFTLFLTACPGPNTYGTARTIDPGKVQATVAVEAIANDADGEVLPIYLPTVFARVGVAKNVDLGLGLHNLGDHFSITAVPGLSYGFAFLADRKDDERVLANTSTGPLARMGLGFQVKPSKIFAFGPEVTWLGHLDSSGSGDNLFFGGIGFHILPGGGEE